MTDPFPMTLVRIAHDVSTQRYHPVIYRDAPMPGPYNPARTVNRYRSYGHHTTGFETLEAAIEQADLDAQKCGEAFGGCPVKPEQGWVVFEVPDIDAMVGVVVVGRTDPEVRGPQVADGPTTS